MRKYILYIPVLALIFTIGFFANVKAGWLLGPSNYDECILQYIKNSKNNYAITKIRKACHDKFYIPYVPKKKKKQADPNKTDWDEIERSIEKREMWSKKMCNCILENMKNVDNNRAAFLIYKSCSEKTGEWRYPPKHLFPAYKKNEPNDKKKLIKKNGKYYYIPEE